MTTHDITCAGDHLGDAVVVGSIELPDDTSADRAAAAGAGYLCDDCGPAYTALVAGGNLLPGTVPTRAQVAAALLALGRKRKRR